MKGIKIKYLLAPLIILCLLLGASCELPSLRIPPPSTPTPADQNELLPDFTAVIAKVKPSVVAINTEFTTYDIFNQPYTQEGAGSGWIIDDAGYIVTNNHVVAGASNITVTLDDGRTFPAT